jgi:hypothetical protein
MSNPSVVGQVGLQDPRNLDMLPCHSQTTRVRRPFLAPSFLGLKGHVEHKLIIMIIIIDLTLQIKSIFFFYNSKIYFKFNNINEFNNINDINNDIKVISLKFL